MEESPFSELENKEEEIPTWILVFEKLIGIGLLLLGLTITLGIAVSLSIDLQRDYLPAGQENTLVSFLLDNAVQIVIALNALLGGILLIVHNKVGWTIATFISSLLTLFLGYLLAKTIITSSLDYILSGLIFGCILIVMFLGALYILFRREIRQRYEVTKKDYIVVFSMLIVFSIMNFLLTST